MLKIKSCSRRIQISWVIIQTLKLNFILININFSEINGILVCYKTGIIPVRMPPPVPISSENSYENEMVIAMNRSNISKKPPQPLPQENDYEEIQSSYRLKSVNSSNYSTIGTYSELEGIPFVINPNLIKTNTELPTAPNLKMSDFEYDFQIERQILCTMKSSSSTNPFFK